jgi:hypothetical protein
MAMGNGDIIQSFAALGQILDREPYLVDMGDGFIPHRRDVKYVSSQETLIKPLSR